MQIIKSLIYKPMKYINKISFLFLLSILLGISITSCTNEDPVVLHVKPTAQFVQQYKDFYTIERQILDSAKLGYLKGNYNTSQTTNFTKYKAAYLADLRTDSTLLATPGVTMAQLVAINKSMATTGFYFINRINVCDRQVLADSLTSAMKVYSSLTAFTGFNGYAAGKVLSYDKGQMLTAISQAQPARDSATYVLAQVNKALLILQTAIPIYYNAIIPSDLPTYQAQCLSYIKAQLTKCYSVTVGYGYYQYVPLVYNNYVNALRADSILADPNSSKPATTVELMAKGMITLGTTAPPSGPRVNFVSSVSNRIALNDSIVVAQTLYNNTPVGTASGQVASFAKTTFNNAIGAATTSRDNPLTADTDISAATFNLSKAQLIFTTAIIK
jgi:hypothetical protein